MYHAESEFREQFIEGWQLCTEIDHEFDVDEGKRHTFPLLLRVYDEVISHRYGISRTDCMEFWSQAFALDTLISNTDRHTGSWAIMVCPSGDREAPFATTIQAWNLNMRTGVSIDALAKSAE